MVRLAISVEGVTEERFIKHVLAPHLQTRAIYATPVMLGGRGGDVSIGRIRKDLNPLARSFDVVTTFYDFYGFRGKSVDESKSSLEQRIRACVAPALQSRVMPYVQMYEFEALLFASPEAIEIEIGQAGLAAWAQRVLQAFGGNPERINDSQQTAPSKRLARKTGSYLKSVHAPNIVKEIGFSALRQHCAGFGKWVTDLESLREAG